MARASVKPLLAILLLSATLQAFAVTHHGVLFEGFQSPMSRGVVLASLSPDASGSASLAVAIVSEECDKIIGRPVNITLPPPPPPPRPTPAPDATELAPLDEPERPAPLQLWTGAVEGTSTEKNAACYFKASLSVEAATAAGSGDNLTITFERPGFGAVLRGAGRVHRVAYLSNRYASPAPAFPFRANREASPLRIPPGTYGVAILSIDSAEATEGRLTVYQTAGEFTGVRLSYVNATVGADGSVRNDTRAFVVDPACANPAGPAPECLPPTPVIVGRVRNGTCDCGREGPRPAEGGAQSGSQPPRMGEGEAPRMGEGEGPRGPAPNATDATGLPPPPRNASRPEGERLGRQREGDICACPAMQQSGAPGAGPMRNGSVGMGPQQAPPQGQQQSGSQQQQGGQAPPQGQQQSGSQQQQQGGQAPPQGQQSGSQQQQGGQAPPQGQRQSGSQQPQGGQAPPQGQQSGSQQQQGGQAPPQGQQQSGSQQQQQGGQAPPQGQRQSGSQQQEGGRAPPQGQQQSGSQQKQGPQPPIYSLRWTIPLPPRQLGGARGGPRGNGTRPPMPPMNETLPPADAPRPPMNETRPPRGPPAGQERRMTPIPGPVRVAIVSLKDARLSTDLSTPVSLLSLPSNVALTTADGTAAIPLGVFVATPEFPFPGSETGGLFASASDDYYSFPAVGTFIRSEPGLFTSIQIQLALTSSTASSGALRRTCSYMASTAAASPAPAGCVSNGCSLLQCFISYMSGDNSGASCAAVQSLACASGATRRHLSADSAAITASLSPAGGQSPAGMMAGLAAAVAGASGRSFADGAAAVLSGASLPADAVDAASFAAAVSGISAAGANVPVVAAGGSSATVLSATSAVAAPVAAAAGGSAGTGGSAGVSATTTAAAASSSSMEAAAGGGSTLTATQSATSGAAASSSGSSGGGSGGVSSSAIAIGAAVGGTALVAAVAGTAIAVQRRRRAAFAAHPEPADPELGAAAPQLPATPVALAWADPSQPPTPTPAVWSQAARYVLRPAADPKPVSFDL